MLDICQTQDLQNVDKKTLAKYRAEICYKSMQLLLAHKDWKRFCQETQNINIKESDTKGYVPRQGFDFSQTTHLKNTMEDKK